MNAQWKQIDPGAVERNVFELIGTDWMLVTAGVPDNWNTMTASWGSLGVLWGRKVGTCFVRPTRHTFRFIDAEPYYTLSFFDESHREALNYCGSHSGREVDKAAATGLEPVALGGSVSFRQARLVFLCRKLYAQDLDPALFLDAAIHGNYPKHDYHRMYIGEIVSAHSR